MSLEDKNTQKLKLPISKSTKKLISFPLPMSQKSHLLHHLRHHLLHLLLFLSFFIRFSKQQDLNFLYNGFNQGQADLHLDGSTRILSPNGLLQLTNATSQQMGHAFFKNPFDFGSISSESVTFSTQFVCALVPKPGFEGGHGIAFVLSSSIDLTQADPTQYLGLLNISTNGSPDSHLLAVEFDTVQSAEFDDIDKNHVAINQNSMTSVESATASYFSDKENKNISLFLLNGGPIHVWIDYEKFLLTVTIAPLRIQKPSKPLLSKTVNLTAIFPDGKAFLGFSAATGTLVSYQNILGWSFSTSKELLKSFDISKLPRVPRLTKPKQIPPLLIALLILLALIGITVLGGVYLYRRRRYAEVREPWEEPYGPLRYSYESLYKATRGFNRDYCLGRGGFGEVFKGNLPVIGDIAVKRLSLNAEQGLKQFVAEVETMGSLQHRNLVPLLGYCRRKGELLLVSKYMEGGSVDQHLFHNDKPVLSWSQRLVILRDISAALCYLHTGANHAVLHRDIKASNVMLNKELNEAKLGDFGMAKFDDPKGSLSATAAVGTIGYMAPEVITMGTSVKTDVYAFGAFLLEVTCGRRPVEPGLAIEKQNLVKWVCECWRKGSLVDSVDARLRGKFLVAEVEMVLKLGLACTSIAPDFRPDMERVVQYINGNLPLPDFSPDTPGIGVSFCPALMAVSSLAMPSTSMASSNSSPAADNSMFISHTILFGDGR